MNPITTEIQIIQEFQKFFSQIRIFKNEELELLSLLSFITLRKGEKKKILYELINNQKSNCFATCLASPSVEQ